MPKGDTVIVFDCGATNIRVIAINSKGEILASDHFLTTHSQIRVILSTGFGI